MIDLSDNIIKKSRRLYKVSCKTCSADRGYQRKREANKNCKSCENTVKFTGKKHSLESKIKRSAWNQGIDVKDFKGFINNRDQRDRYHAGKLNKTIFKRDNFICDCCRTHGGKLNAHHLESFDVNPKLRLDEANIVTLCATCHLDFHVKYGRGNNTKEQYIKYKEKQ